jgi:hypothetical protein
MQYGKQLQDRPRITGLLDIAQRNGLMMAH